jgi:G3E family GTPase
MSIAEETIPVTIIGGYLGAGKTTLLNALLRGDHGLRLAILVNDFGSINIDAELISSSDGETISLTNGCVCCSMVDNLAMTLLELLGRERPPQQIVIEASGVADPTRIAYYGAAHPGLRLDGLIVVVDAETIRARVHDKYVGELVVRQLAAADLLVVSKTDLIDDTQQNDVRTVLRELVPDATIATAVLGELPADVLLGIRETQTAANLQVATACSSNRGDHSHQFATCRFVSEQPFSEERLRMALNSLPDAVLRAKGLLYLEGGNARTTVLQLVGKRWSLEPGPSWKEGKRLTALVAIGVAGLLDTKELQGAFTAALAEQYSSN